MTTAPRVRFAPSPTGYLHIGGARTALYNWLWARQTGGTFVLRIEDTDRARSTDQSVQAIFDALRWLGLDWDEGPHAGGDCGPYFQTDRGAIYREHAERLVESGHAYRCYATKEQLDEARKEHHERTGSRGFKYPGWWRDKGPADYPAGQDFVYRLKVPEGGATGWDDLVKGRIEIGHKEMQDEVLLRADGIPLYNFGCAVDDLSMGITLVARGDDHVINTPAQILLYEAFGAESPQFAHMPMILDERGKKMSKRDDAGSVEVYRDRGFVPDGLLNYLARLGWSHGDDELFTREELIEKFDWGSVGAVGARYDEKKFMHVQSHHLRGLSREALAHGAAPFLAARGVDVAPDEPLLLDAVDCVRDRATTFADVAERVDYFFRDPPEQEEKAVKKHFKPKFLDGVERYRAMLEDVEVWDAPSLDAATQAWMEETDLGFRDFAQAVRVALSGRSATPGLYEVMTVLGRARSLTRLDAGIAQLRASADD